MRHATVVVQRALTRLYADWNRRRAVRSGAVWLRALRGEFGPLLRGLVAELVTLAIVAIHYLAVASRPTSATTPNVALAAPASAPTSRARRPIPLAAPRPHEPGAHRISRARQPVTASVDKRSLAAAAVNRWNAGSPGAWLTGQRVVGIALAGLVLVASVVAVTPGPSAAGVAANARGSGDVPASGGLAGLDTLDGTGNVLGAGNGPRLVIGGAGFVANQFAAGGPFAAGAPASDGGLSAGDPTGAGTTGAGSQITDTNPGLDIEGFSDNSGFAGDTTPNLPAAIDTSAPSEGPFLSDGTILKPIAVDTTAPDARTLLTKYRVRNGDTLTSIAHHFGLSLVTLYWANHLTVHLKTKTDLRVGQSLSIPPVNGVLHIVTDHETIADISKRTDVPVKRIVDANNLEQATVYVGEWIIIPGAKSPPIPVAAPKRVARPAARASSSGRNPRPVIRPHVTSSGGWVWPVPGGFISQYFHYGHWAIDIATNYGDPVVAAKSGVVIFAGWKNNGGGWQVWMSHGNGIYTTYNHMSSISVGFGQSLSAGQQVGRIGMSGNATGPHCHFEIWIGPVWAGGYRVNPLNYV